MISAMQKTNPPVTTPGDLARGGTGPCHRGEPARGGGRNQMKTGAKDKTSVINPITACGPADITSKGRTSAKTTPKASTLIRRLLHKTDSPSDNAVQHRTMPVVGRWSAKAPNRTAPSTISDAVPEQGRSTNIWCPRRTNRVPEQIKSSKKRPSVAQDPDADKSCNNRPANRCNNRSTGRDRRNRQDSQNGETDLGRSSSRANRKRAKASMHNANPPMKFTAEIWPRNRMPAAQSSRAIAVPCPRCGIEGPEVRLQIASAKVKARKT